MSVKLLFNEFVAINQDRKGIYRNQAKIDFPNGPEDPFTIDIILTPTEGIYLGARVVFRMKLPPNYPESCPQQVSCLTKIFHPNITFDGRVCFNMFSGDWNRSYRLEQFVNGLLWLLANPNPDSALNGTATERDPVKFEEMVRLAMKGVTVKEVTFAPFINTDNADPTFLNSMRLTFKELLTAMKQRKGASEVTMAEILAGEFASILPEGDRHFDLARDMDMSILGGSHKRIHGASTRSRVFGMDRNLMVKEVIFAVDGNPLLVIGCGSLPFDKAVIASALNVPETSITLPKRTTVKNFTGFDVSHVPSFGFGPDLFKSILISSNLNIDDKVICASIIPGTYFKLPGKDLIKLIGKPSIVVDNLQKAVAAPLPVSKPAPLEADICRVEALMGAVDLRKSSGEISVV